MRKLLFKALCAVIALAMLIPAAALADECICGCGDGCKENPRRVCLLPPDHEYETYHEIVYTYYDSQQHLLRNYTIKQCRLCGYILHKSGGYAYLDHDNVLSGSCDGVTTVEIILCRMCDHIFSRSTRACSGPSCQYAHGLLPQADGVLRRPSALSKAFVSNIG